MVYFREKYIEKSNLGLGIQIMSSYIPEGQV